MTLQQLPPLTNKYWYVKTLFTTFILTILPVIYCDLQNNYIVIIILSDKMSIFTEREMW